MKTQVLIVGGGVAGLTAALKLAKHGINVIVVEKKALISVMRIKVSSSNPRRYNCLSVQVFMSHFQVLGRHFLRLKRLNSMCT